MIKNNCNFIVGRTNTALMKLTLPRAATLQILFKEMQQQQSMRDVFKDIG